MGVFGFFEQEENKILLEALNNIYEVGQASVSMVQRRLKIGYSRAAEIMEHLEVCGIISKFDGETPRKILVGNINDAKEILLAYRKVDIEKIIQEEQDWRREQMGLNPIELELSLIDDMEGHDFERWCADLLKKSGFTEVKVTKGSGDQGVDVLAVKDDIKYAVQCKCYSSDLGNTPIQEVHAGKNLYQCHVGAVMTNRRFTAGAKELAKATGVLLWDRDKLIEMLENAG